MRPIAAASMSSGTHAREHRSLLAGVEKQVLVWIAVRLPRRVQADHLTALGSLAMIAAGASLALLPPGISLPLVPVFLAINWFGDSLDGTVARVRGRERPRYGFYVDHAVDLVNAAALFGGLACSGAMRPSIALSLLAAYLALGAESFLAIHALGVFRLSFSGVGPTELRVLLAIGAIGAAGKPVVSLPGLGSFALLDVGGAIAAAAMTAAFFVTSWRNARLLAHADALPPDRVEA